MGNILMTLFVLGLYGLLTILLIGAWAESDWLAFGIVSLIALPFYAIPVLFAAAVISEYRRAADEPGHKAG